MLSVLEVLMAAKARIEDEPDTFRFMALTTCTCGHIYRAALGVPPLMAVSKPTGEFAGIILAVARALGYRGNKPERALWFVSTATSANAAARLGIDEPENAETVTEVADAVAVLDRAIAAIQAEDEQNRQAVLREAAAIVDNAPLPVLAPAFNEDAAASLQRPAA